MNRPVTIDPDRLEAYVRHINELQYDTVCLPPFVLFFTPGDPSPYGNYAKPLEPVGGDLGAPLELLRGEFRGRGRLPRFEFVEQFAPDLAAALAAAGFQEESRLHLMVCTPETFRPAPPVAGLEVMALGPHSPRRDVRALLRVQREGFGMVGDELQEGDDLPRAMQGGSQAFLARLDGQAVGAGGYQRPYGGVTEVVGIATLEAFRRRGVATALTAAATRMAFDNGVAIAFLTAGDERAGRVYERVGFRPFATMLAYSDGTHVHS
ncbi:MAG TPA: GNAT family N-acetyltransferase [Ardenticatenaceae bacterium]|nr:GNAT family N-acetyltransferase [Ardenticatenaceae bacterium]